MTDSDRGKYIIHSLHEYSKSTPTDELLQVPALKTALKTMVRYAPLTHPTAVTQLIWCNRFAS